MAVTREYLPLLCHTKASLSGIDQGHKTTYIVAILRYSITQWRCRPILSR